MERIKSLIVSTLIILIVIAGFGFGIMVVGFALVLGAAFALAVRLSSPNLTAEGEKCAEDVHREAAGAAPANA